MVKSLHQTVWVPKRDPNSSGGWKVVGRAPIGFPVDHILGRVPPGERFSVSVGGLVVFNGILG